MPSDNGAYNEDVLDTNIPDGEQTYKDTKDYDSKQQSRAELASLWAGRITAADKTYRAWANRFKVDVLYQYYEGFQWLYETDENNRPYVINMIYSTIENKLPNMLFENPEYSLRPQPTGMEYDEEAAEKTVQSKEDALNFVVRRPEFGFNDKHELAALDAFFGFGIMEVGYSDEQYCNPSLSEAGDNPLDNLFCKQIPFDTFRVAATANWDLSVGKWWGYWEFVPQETLTKYVKRGLRIEPKYSAADMGDSDFTAQFLSEGKIVTGEQTQYQSAPSGTIKIWRLWDFNKMKFCMFCPDAATFGDRILEYKTFDHCGISVLRYGKRRRGWYPLPPVFQWIHPQDEINDIHQTMKVHRKRFSRKYTLVENMVDDEEVDKLLYGPDGQIIKVKREGALQPIQDAAMDPINPMALSSSYADLNRVSGVSDDTRSVADRQTATQSNILANSAKVRDSKALQSVATFLALTGRNILKSLREANKAFWALTNLEPEALLGELKSRKQKWKKIPPQIFKDNDCSVDVKVTSISPVYQQEDKTTFMEFLAVLTQYEVIAFSPALLREAAYRIGYKNESVLGQFQQLSQLASIGRLMAAKQAIAQPVPGPGQQGPMPLGSPGSPPMGPQPTPPGQLAQHQMSASMPPTHEQIINHVFNKQGVQHP